MLHEHAATARNASDGEFTQLRRLADIGKARELLSFTPSVSLEQGMKELTAWYFEKQTIKENV